jgi:hypothetical protein
MRKLTRGERELINEIITNYPLYKEKLDDCQAELAVVYDAMKKANDAGNIGGGGSGAISDPTLDVSLRKIRLEMDLEHYRDYIGSTEKVLKVYKDNSEMMTLVRTKYWSGQFDWERDRNMDLLIEMLGYTSNERRFYALLNSFRWKMGIMHGILRRE